MQKTLILCSILLIISCKSKNSTEPKPVKEDCPAGQLPCEQDSTICCNVICPPGTFLGGPDSTECLPIICPPGQILCEYDSSNCCDIICPEGYHLDEIDSTECLLDTTSHSFLWQVDVLGNYGSQLNDVAIVHENNIWVVGNIETDSMSYNAAHWNGNEWEFIEIINTADLYSIYYFSENDIWVTKYSYPVHWDGNNWTQYNLTELGITGSPGQAIWGTTSSNIFFIGIEGFIVHYDGENFIQMESGTDIKLNDIAGTPDGEYAFVAGRNDSGESIALMIHENNVELLYEGENMFSEPYGGIKVVSVRNDTAYFASQMGLWKYNFLTDSSTFIQGDEIYFTNRGIRKIGTQTANDISIITYWSELIHFNGSTWHLDTTVLDQFGPYNIQASGMDFKGNLIVSVGYAWSPVGAFVARGYRF